MVNKDKGKEFIVNKSDIIVDGETGEKYVTITVNSKMLHYIFQGLGKYKEGFKGESGTNKEERDNTNKLIDEFDEVKNILNKEVVVKTKGKQEPNPKEDITGTT